MEEHGATEKESAFLTEPDDEGLCRRVELNAMTSRQLVDFLVEKLKQGGAKKVLPSHDTLANHARRMIEQKLTRKALAEMAAEIAQQAENTELPADLAERVRRLLEERPEMSWDQAVAQILERV